MSWWPFKRSPPRLEAVPEPSEEDVDPLEEQVEQLRRQVNALRYDLDDLIERFTRRSGRENKAASRGAPADGARPQARTGNGLPSLAVLRAQGRSPFGGS